MNIRYNIVTVDMSFLTITNKPFIHLNQLIYPIRIDYKEEKPKEEEFLEI